MTATARITIDKPHDKVMRAVLVDTEGKEIASETFGCGCSQAMSREFVIHDNASLVIEETAAADAPPKSPKKRSR